MQESHGLGLRPALLARSRHIMKKLTPHLMSDCQLLSASPPFPLGPTPTQLLGMPGGSLHWGWREGPLMHTRDLHIRSPGLSPL